MSVNKKLLINLKKLGAVGHCSIVDKASAYGTKGPVLATMWRQQFMNL